MSTTPSSDDLLAELAVVRVVNRYASAVDRVDLELLRSCFVEEAEASYMGRELPPGVEHIVEMIGGLDPDPGTIHNLGPIAAEVSGDEASLRAGCLVLAVPDPAANQGVVRGVRYAFRLRRDAGEWRITHLQHQIIWATAAPRSDPRGGPL